MTPKKISDRNMREVINELHPLQIREGISATELPMVREIAKLGNVWEWAAARSYVIVDPYPFMVFYIVSREFFERGGGEVVG